MQLLDSEVLLSFVNPNTLYFWAFWGMLSIVILIKSWHRILRFKYDMETTNWIKKSSDEEIKKIYDDHRDTEKHMKEKYPDWTPLNEHYDRQIKNEYTKRNRKQKLESLE